MEFLYPLDIAVSTHIVLIYVVFMDNLIPEISVVLQLPVILHPSGHIIGSPGASLHILDITGDAFPVHVPTQIIKTLIRLQEAHLSPPFRARRLRLY